MQKTKRTMRLAVLSKLFEHLREHYDLEWIPDDAPDDHFSVHQVDAALAFKSDSVLDELRSALFRLDEGNFGVCINCKRQIGEDILHVDPTQRICPSCERSLTHLIGGQMSSHVHVAQ